jgi:hypothetical protein
VDLTEDALNQFSRKVQPILMNACASCHTGTEARGGSFKLIRCHETTLTGGRTTYQNLAAVLAQVNPREPSFSPLLTKAVTKHAVSMAHAPLKDRAAPAYRTLEGWLAQTLVDNPQLKLREGPAAPPATSEAPPAAPRDVPGWGADREAGPAVPSVAKEKVVAIPGSTPPAAPNTAAPAAPDPVSPEDFNRQFHPGRKPPPPAPTPAVPPT